MGTTHYGVQGGSRGTRRACRDEMSECAEGMGGPAAKKGWLLLGSTVLTILRVAHTGVVTQPQHPQMF